MTPGMACAHVNKEEVIKKSLHKKIVRTTEPLFLHHNTMNHLNSCWYPILTRPHYWVYTKKCSFRFYHIRKRVDHMRNARTSRILRIKNGFC